MDKLPFTRIERAIANFVAPRMGWWLYLSLLLLAAVAYLAQPMLKVILYKVVIATLLAFVGDKIARAMEASNARPHELMAQAESWRTGHQATAEDPLGQIPREDIAVHLEQRADAIYLRRAIVIAAAMIAGALGT